MLSYQVSQIPRGVRGILVATTVAYLVELIFPHLALDWCSLVPQRVFLFGEIWRLVTYLFLHEPSSPFHLIFNMLALWMFGVELEQLWGTRRFLIFYAIAGIGSGLFSVLSWNTEIIGASGAIIGLLTVYAIYFPDRTILFFFIFPLPVRMAVFIIGAISILGSMTSGSGVAHLTHLGGILAGLLYVYLYNRVSTAAVKVAVAVESAQQKQRDAEVMNRKRYFADVIDPILKKISESGMDSLSDDEKKRLKEAGKNDREEFKKRKIIPLDAFKRKKG